MRLPDRLRAPNDDAGFAEASRDVFAAARQAVRRRRLQHRAWRCAAEPLSLRVKAKSAPTLAALLAASGG